MHALWHSANKHRSVDVHCMLAAHDSATVLQLPLQMWAQLHSAPCNCQQDLQLHATSQHSRTPTQGSPEHAHADKVDADHCERGHHRCCDAAAKSAWRCAVLATMAELAARSRCMIWQRSWRMLCVPAVLHAWPHSMCQHMNVRIGNNSCALALIANDQSRRRIQAHEASPVLAAAPRTEQAKGYGAHAMQYAVAAKVSSAHVTMTNAGSSRAHWFFVCLW